MINVSFPLVDEQRLATDLFRTWMLTQDPLTGVGSPEGVVKAPQFRFYIDSTGATGSLLYIKVQSDISGDKSQGWVAV